MKKLLTAALTVVLSTTPALAHNIGRAHEHKDHPDYSIFANEANFVMFVISAGLMLVATLLVFYMLRNKPS